MKKIIFLLLLFVITWDVYSQTTRAATSGFVPRANQTFVVEDGILSARNGLFVPRYTDTTQANTFIFKDTAGNVIYTYATQSLWVRVNETASNNKWVAVGGGGGSGTVTSVSGTANQIAVATGTTTPVISLVTGGTLPGAWNLGTPSALVGTNISGTAAALSIGGNAATATALATGRTISISGDLTYTSPSFDGTGNVTAAGTLATVNANVGTFGSATQVPQLTVNAKGLITAVSNVTITVPTASLLPITGTGTATGAVIGSLAGNTLDIQQGANYFLKLDPTAGAENAELQAYNTTGAGNLARFQATASNTNAEYLIQGVFNATSEFSLNGSAVSGGSSLSYDADTHQFTGNVGIGVSPTVLFQVQSGGQNLIQIDPTAGAEQSFLQAYNTTGGGNYGAVFGNASNIGASFDIAASFNGEAEVAIISGNVVSGSALLTYSADTHTFTGTIQPVSDNSTDIGTSSASFKDIYSRTLKLDGSTSGTVTIASDALANVGNGTNLSGTGIIPFDFEIVVRNDETLANSNADQPLFTNTAHDLITIQANTTYDYYLEFDLTHGAVAHNLEFGMIPTTATITNITSNVIAWVTAVGTNTATQNSLRSKTTATTQVIASGANATETCIITGWFTVGATGGSIMPTIQFSADPTGTVLLKAGARFRLTARGNDTYTEIGPIN